MKILCQLSTFMILIFIGSIASAQEGPEIPCVGCETLTQAPYPETGSWYNPDQSGTGINIEVQDGRLLGNYYGYTVDGDPEWYIFHGQLVRSETDNLVWDLDTTMEYFEGGNCIGCEYQPPMTPTDGPAIKLEFLQRNNLRITIGENPGQYFVPIIYGSLGAKYFEDETPYVFPTYAGGIGHEYATYFMFVEKPNTNPPSPWLWVSSIRPIGAGRVVSGGSDEGKLYYTTWIPTGPPGPDVFPSIIECELDQVSSQPGCKWVLGTREYVIPIGNMNDSRIFGEADDGWTIEGYRLDYD